MNSDDLTIQFWNKCRKYVLRQFFKLGLHQVGHKMSLPFKNVEYFGYFCLKNFNDNFRRNTFSEVSTSSFLLLQWPFKTTFAYFIDSTQYIGSSNSSFKMFFVRKIKRVIKLNALYDCGCNNVYSKVTLLQPKLQYLVRMASIATFSIEQKRASVEGGKDENGRKVLLIQLFIT